MPAIYTNPWLNPVSYFIWLFLNLPLAIVVFGLRPVGKHTLERSLTEHRMKLAVANAPSTAAPEETKEEDPGTD